MLIRAFVSSTYRDLKDHRAYVIERLERSGLVVDPMEKWSAASDEPKTLSEKRVAGCHLCILLAGFRRGHVPEGETRSITQMEFAQAWRSGITTFVFLANEQADWPVDAISELERDGEMRRWRDQLREHGVAGFFGPQPQSIDVDAAVNRWLQNHVAAAHPPSSAPDLAGAIDIRAYSNSDGVLVVWRTERPVEHCLGFVLHRQILGDAGIADEIVSTRAGFATTARSSELAPSSERPIQRFRWFDRERREARYRVAEVTGSPEALSEASAADEGSAWTSWISTRTGENPGCRAFFNAPSSDALRRRAGAAGTRRGESTASKPGVDGEAAREYLGGGLRQRLMQLLVTARLGDRRVYAALSGLDDPGVVERLASLGKRLHLVLAARDGSRRVLDQLRAASVTIYPPARGNGSGRSNFAVCCDRWGTPVSVWMGSGPWTVRALCLSANNGIVMESLPVARAVLDRWEDLRDAGTQPLRRAKASSAPIHIREQAMAVSLWGTPTRGTADLRDARRLIRGARQGVLFLVHGGRFASTLTKEVQGLLADEDLFIEGVSSWPGNGSRGRHEYLLNGQRSMLSGRFVSHSIDSTIVLVDPFGPHPVVMTGSHDLSARTSGKDRAELLILENAPELAREYAVYLVALFDRHRWRSVAAAAGGHGGFVGLQPDARWQDRYFDLRKRSEFNFLFGSLSPGV